MATTERKHVELLMKEREIMRGENLNVTKTLWRTVIGFITSVVLFLGYYLKGDVKKENLNDYWVMLGATQVAFILFLFAIGIWAAQVVYIGYIKALEHKLNEKAGTLIVFWESQMSAHFTGTPKGAFFITWFIINASFVLLLLFMYGLLVYVFSDTKFVFISLGIAVIEVGILVYLLLRAKGDMDKASDRAHKIFSGQPPE